MAYLPLNRAARFSTNALRPSRTSGNVPWLAQANPTRPM
jgi:hypothetical protein